MKCRSRRRARFQGRARERQPLPRSQLAGRLLRRLPSQISTPSPQHTAVDSRPHAPPNPWRIGNSPNIWPCLSLGPTVSTSAAPRTVLVHCSPTPHLHYCTSSRSKFRFDLAVNLELTGEIPAEELGLEDTDKGTGADLP